MAKNMFDHGSFLRRRKRYKKLTTTDYHPYPQYQAFHELPIPISSLPKLQHTNIKTEPDDESMIPNSNHRKSNSTTFCTIPFEQENKQYKVNLVTASPGIKYGFLIKNSCPVCLFVLLQSCYSPAASICCSICAARIDIKHYCH